MLYALHTSALAKIECGDAYHTVKYQLVARNVAGYYSGTKGAS